ncbi:MAG TPA: ATP-binding protein [Kofleriaceae bacterium]|nr:ATP-binding protein [Kofleriaceae bacterium]
MPTRLTRTSTGIVRALSRLTVVQRVSGIGALFLVLVLTSSLAFIAREWGDHRVARGEMSALPAASALLKLARLTAEHRGLSAGMLAGDPELADRRAWKQVEVDQFLGEALDATGRWSTPRIRRLRLDVAERWGSLRVAVVRQEVSGRESFERHTTLIEGQLALLDEVVSVSSMTLDADPVARNLIVAALRRLPLVIELIGELRGYGTNVIASSTTSPDDRGWLAATLTNARRMFDSGMIQIQRAGEVDPSVLVALGPRMTDARARFEQLSSLVEVAAGGRRMAAVAYFAAITEAIEAQSALGDSTFAVLDTVLKARAGAARRAAAIAVAACFALLLMSSWLVWSIIRSIQGDLRSREEARRAATRTSAFLSTVLEAAPDAVVIVNDEGIIELVSSQVELMFGHERDELIGRSARVLFPESALPVTTDLSAAAGLDRRAVAAECVRKDGTRFPMELGSSPVQVGQTRHLIVVGRDVTERRAMEQQLQQSQRMESIGQLTGGLAHDFNNLLGVIVGNLDLLERHVASDVTASGRVRTAQRAAMRGSDLTRRLLAFARRQHLDPQPTEVNQMIGELLEMLPRTLGPEIRIVTRLEAELPSATVDPSGLESALLNLALNARDAMTGGAGKLSIATTLVHLDGDYGPVHAGEMAAGSYIKITVSDTGHGMSPETIGKVFEPFFTTKPRGKGTGLGLSMVYGFVKQSRGNIRVYSELGVGTTFTICLPLAEEGAPARAVSTTAPLAMLPEGGARPIVLVVDDEVDLLEIAVSYCEELGFQVLHATDGPSALEIAAEQPHLDLLLTDVVMPGGLNGVALAARLRARYPDLKVVYCSGFPSSALAERSQLRADGPLINKPYLKQAFARCVIDALAAPIAATEEHAA